MVPFGVGKRVCLGQTLAEKEFFLFFAGMIQQFSFVAAPVTISADDDFFFDTDGGKIS